MEARKRAKKRKRENAKIEHVPRSPLNTNVIENARIEHESTKTQKRKNAKTAKTRKRESIEHVKAQHGNAKT